jgi:hypothetical protein
MVGSLSGTGRANGLRQDLDVGPHQDVEDREVAHTVKDKSLEEMASDLRSLSGQLMTARVMGVKGGVKGDPDSGIGGGIDGDADNPAMAPAVRLVATCWWPNSAARWSG